MREMEKEKKEKVREDRMATGGFVEGYVKSLENPINAGNADQLSPLAFTGGCGNARLSGKGKELAIFSLMRAL